MAIPSQLAIDENALRRFLDGEHEPVRERMRALLCEPRFARVEGLNRQQYRDQVLEWLRALAQDGAVLHGFPGRYGGGDNVGASIASFEVLALSDTCRAVGASAACSSACSVATRAAAGHPRAPRALPEAGTATLRAAPGCFAMTETGHGSNVQALQHGRL